MSLAWETVIDVVLRTVEQSPERVELDRISVVRDLNGRIRLAIRPAPARAPDATALEQRIAASLGAWLARPILWTNAAAVEEARLARNIVATHQTWPAGWARDWDDGLGRRTPITAGLWTGEQRVRSKDAWLRQDPVRPPWPLQARTPAIVSFYSFKGGVGRTTLLGVVAHHLANAGRRVVVLDLDLEAPGLGRFFGVHNERGVLDLLLEHTATGTIDTGDLPLHVAEIPRGGGNIFVVPVGAITASYIERLACLDYAPRSGDQRSSIEVALRSVLGLIHRRYRPDFILVDARAGLHDLGGLSLHALAHLDVLVGRSAEVTLDGFKLALGTLAQRRQAEELRLLVAQSFLPLPLEEPESRQLRDEWRAQLYAEFTPTIYRRLYTDAQLDLPAETDDGAMHHPWPVPRFDALDRIEKFDRIDPAILQAQPFKDITDRVLELCARPALGADEQEEEDDGREGAI